MTIKSSVPKKFWMEDVINTLLSCFPEKDIKKSIYSTLTKTLIIDNEKISEIINESDEFTGDIQEQNSLIINLIKQLNNSLDTLWNANRDNSNNINNDNNDNTSDELRKLEVIFDENNNIKKITFQNNKLNKLNDETTIISNNNNQTLSSTNLNDDLSEKQDFDDINFCIIKFKYPNGEKFIEKKFSKTEKVISLFNFVESLGRDIYSNQNFNTFELIHDFPPKYLSQVKNNNLLEEGLFPTSLVSIIEK